MPRESRSYGAVAWCYDELAAAWSLGRIRASKLHHVRSLGAGERVLYAGVGRGDDALAAAGAGARVVALDVSGAMLRRLERRLRRRGLRATLRREDVLRHRPDMPYDAVVAGYLLSCFAEPEARRVLAALVACVRPGGRVFLADFAPPRGGAAARRLARLHFAVVCAAGRALGLAAWHPLHDPAAWLEDLGLQGVERTPFPSGRRGPVLFEAIAARRPAAPPLPGPAAPSAAGRARP